YGLLGSPTKICRFPRSPVSPTGHAAVPDLRQPFLPRQNPPRSVQVKEDPEDCEQDGHGNKCQNTKNRPGNIARNGFVGPARKPREHPRERAEYNARRGHDGEPLIAMAERSVLLSIIFLFF